MPSGGLLNVVHHDFLHLIGVVVVHDEHNTLLKLITTLYGCVLAHMIFGPIAQQLRKRDEEEVLCKLIIVRPFLRAIWASSTSCSIMALGLNRLVFIMRRNEVSFCGFY